jgi:hypothetical protein
MDYDDVSKNNLIDLCGADVEPRTVGGERPKKRSREFPEEFASLGEDVLACKLVRDNIMRMGRFNPRNIQHVRTVLTLTSLRLSNGDRVLSDQDLRDIYFKDICGFKNGDFFVKDPKKLPAYVDAVEKIHEKIYQKRVDYTSINVVLPTPPPSNLFSSDQLWEMYWFVIYVPVDIISTISKACYVERVLRAPSVQPSFMKMNTGNLLIWGAETGIDDLFYKFELKGVDVQEWHVERAITAAKKYHFGQTVRNLSRYYRDKVNDPKFEHQYSDIKRKYAHFKKIMDFVSFGMNE